MVEESVELSRLNWRTKFRAYIELLKLRLSILVGFSGAIGYMMAENEQHSVTRILIFCVTGLFITGAANATNQVLESELDKMMKRTGNRPLPSGRLSKRSAQYFIAVLLFSGLFLQTFLFNPLTAAVSFISFLLYGFVYTPLKRVGPIAVFVGAIPGGLPPLIGWVAATGTITIEPLILFAHQFMWQFPHFWAIAWVLDEDYRKAGFNLLPLNQPKSRQTALFVLAFTTALLPISALPTYLGMVGDTSALVAIIAGLLFLYLNVRLVQNSTDKDARWLMFGSFLYLPLVQVAYVLDKM